MKRLAPLFVVAVLLMACSSGPSAEEQARIAEATRAAEAQKRAEALDRAAAPVVKAHDALKDFSRRVDGGMTRGDFARTWPDVYAQVVRYVVDDVKATGVEGVESEDIRRLAAYVDAIRDALTKWVEARDYNAKILSGDKRDCSAGITKCVDIEPLAAKALQEAQAATRNLDRAKDTALRAGRQ